MLVAMLPEGSGVGYEREDLRLAFSESIQWWKACYTFFKSIFFFNPKRSVLKISTLRLLRLSTDTFI